MGPECLGVSVTHRQARGISGVALWRRLGEIRNGPPRRGDRSVRESPGGTAQSLHSDGLGNELPHKKQSSTELL